jgi:hypothetical protein
VTQGGVDLDDRIELAGDFADPVAGRLLGEAGSQNARVARDRNLDHVVQAGRQSGERRRRRQHAGRLADHLFIDRLVRPQRAFGGDPLGGGEGEAGLGLGHVGAGHLADREAIAGRFELALDDPFVVLVERDHGLVAPDIHVGGGRAEQD